MSNIDKDMLLGASIATGNMDRYDVLSMIDDGAITSEDGRELITMLESGVIKFDKDMKQTALHRHACIVLAQRASDPAYRKLANNFAEREKLFQELDEKYGKEATINQKTLVNSATDLTSESVKQKLKVLN